MHFLMVCLCLAASRPTSARARATDLNSTSTSTNTSFFSMPVQFSMAAPASSNPDQGPELSDRDIHRRGYPGPPRPHRRKHRPSHEEMMHMYALRQRGHHPKYPPFLEPYSHNYRQSNLHHPPPPDYYFKPAGHRLPSNHRPQQGPYIEYPPYASRYQPTGNSHSEPTRHEQHPQFAAYHQSEQQQQQQQDQQQPSSHQSLVGEYSQYSPQFQQSDQHSHQNNYQSSNTEYQQYPPHFLSSEQSYPQKHQAHHFEYSQPPPDYQTGDETYSQFPSQNYQHRPEYHNPNYQPSEYIDSPMYGGPQMQPHGSRHPPSPDSPPPPEYNPEMTKELRELHKEISLMQLGGNSSSRSMLHLLVPLLMLGISIPAIGYMYSHMIRRRSFQDDAIQEYMQLLQQGIECYQQKGQCSKS